MPYTYEYPRPAVTVDVAVFAERGGELSVLLIERKHDPFAGTWALPGGFVDENEALEHAARRELEEETGLTVESLTQVGAFGDPGRDPRGHTVSVVYLTRVDADAVKVTAGDDAAKAQWFRWSELRLEGEGVGVPLAFDHAHVLRHARRKLEARSASAVEEADHRL